MTIDHILATVSDSLTAKIIKGRKKVAEYDGRNSIPVEFNHLEIERMVRCEDVLMLYV